MGLKALSHLKKRRNLQCFERTKQTVFDCEESFRIHSRFETVFQDFSGKSKSGRKISIHTVIVGGKFFVSQEFVSRLQIRNKLAKIFCEALQIF